MIPSFGIARKNNSPEVHSKVSSLHHIRVRLDLVPPESGHEQHVPRAQHTLCSPGPRKEGEALQVGGSNVHGRHHHGSALQKPFPPEFLHGEVGTEDGLRDVALVEILVVMRFEESEMLLSRNLRF